MQTINTLGAPKPAGHYSQAVVQNGMVYVSGQLPISPLTGEVVGSDAETQTEQALVNVEAILEAAGSGLASLVSVTLYITDRDHWEGVNRAYARLLGGHRPARAVIPVSALKRGCLVEIQAIASTNL